MMLFQGEWLEIHRTDGGYEYMRQRKGQGCAVLPYRLRGDVHEVVCRYEVVPPHGPDVEMVSLTGMIDRGEQPHAAALRELYEEAGIRVLLDELRPLGAVRPSKASDSTVHLFGVPNPRHDVPTGQRFEGPGDGSDGERGSYCMWRPAAHVLTATSDSLLCTMIARMVRTLV
jgi:8-oxo-dGTP pyrophosphatase MutT (NUDIX family)